MAKIGLSQSFYAKYAYNNGAVTYSNGGTLGKAVECTIELEDSDAVVFYANNGPAESVSAFGGGTLTLTNDSMPLAATAAILGLETATVSTPSGTSLTFPGALTPPYVGYGTVAKLVVSNTITWRALLLPKVQFQIPADSFTTQEETIEFSGHELSAVIMRSDAANNPWKIYADFDTEANAVTWLKAQLSIT